MEEAIKRMAVTSGKFWFRNNIFTEQSPSDISGRKYSKAETDNDSCDLMTMDEIVNGVSANFPGLVPLCRLYLERSDIDIESHQVVSKYLDLIAGRASGKYFTAAQWMRNFVQAHPEYKKDSVVNERINYDLMMLIGKISTGEVVVKELVGESSNWLSEVKSTTN